MDRQKQLDDFNKWVDALAEEDLRNPYFQQTYDTLPPDTLSPVESEASDATEKGKQSENGESKHTD